MKPLDQSWLQLANHLFRDLPCVRWSSYFDNWKLYVTLHRFLIYWWWSGDMCFWTLKLQTGFCVPFLYILKILPTLTSSHLIHLCSTYLWFI